MRGTCPADPRQCLLIISSTQTSLSVLWSSGMGSTAARTVICSRRGSGGIPANAYMLSVPVQADGSRGRRKLHDQCSSLNGFTISSEQISEKSCSFRVTSAQSWTMAVAAMTASGSFTPYIRRRWMAQSAIVSVRGYTSAGRIKSSAIAYPSGVCLSEEFYLCDDRNTERRRKHILYLIRAP